MLDFVLVHRFILAPMARGDLLETNRSTAFVVAVEHIAHKLERATLITIRVFGTKASRGALEIFGWSTNAR